jgi:hypothetical protein
MEGTYYIQELDAGEDHNIDLTHHEFEFKATDHETEKVIELYASKDNQEDELLPLLNKLHFNQFSLKKVSMVILKCRFLVIQKCWFLIT